MWRISVVEDLRRRRLIVEGKLIAPPCAAELTSEYKKAKKNLDSRELVVDVTNLSAISAAGESAILELMNDNATFHSGVFMKEVLRQLAYRIGTNRHRPDNGAPDA